MTHRNDTGLPPEIADRFTEAFVRFLRIEAAAGARLLLATCTALILSNSAWSTLLLAFWETPIGLHFGSLDFSPSLRHWINDGLTTLFFFVVALELKRDLVLGELRNPRMAALSLWESGTHHSSHGFVGFSSRVSYMAREQGALFLE